MFFFCTSQDRTDENNKKAKEKVANKAKKLLSSPDGRNKLENGFIFFS